MNLTKLSISLLTVIGILSISTIVFAYQYYDTYDLMVNSMELLLECIKQNVYYKSGEMPLV